jgi:drug/metabolite transporter (DMT)-like permease
MFAVSTRFILAGTIMALVVRWRGGTMRVSWRALGSCAVVGILLPGANALLFYAEEDVPTGLASLLIASVPLWVVLLRLIGRERLGTRAWPCSPARRVARPRPGLRSACCRP